MEVERFIKGDIVLITWRDSNRYWDAQYTEDEKFDVEHIMSVGFVINDNEDYLSLAQDKIGDESIRGVITIPSENIYKRKKIYDNRRSIKKIR